jgi:hypothetical protein
VVLVHHSSLQPRTCHILPTQFIMRLPEVIECIVDEHSSRAGVQLCKINNVERLLLCLAVVCRWTSNAAHINLFSFPDFVFQSSTSLWSCSAQNFSYSASDWTLNGVGLVMGTKGIPISSNCSNLALVSGLLLFTL